MQWSEESSGAEICRSSEFYGPSNWWLHWLPYGASGNHIPQIDWAKQSNDFLWHMNYVYSHVAIAIHCYEYCTFIKYYWTLHYAKKLCLSNYLYWLLMTYWVSEWGPENCWNSSLFILLLCYINYYILERSFYLFATGSFQSKNVISYWIAGRLIGDNGNHLERKIISVSSFI